LNSANLPKKIWFLWLQGLVDAPLVVRKCYSSWLRHNPGWEVIFLDENNIGDFIPLPDISVTQQALSDILRINLLARYGGVWVDATVFCTKPLDEWLYQHMASGFFAFERPGPDRMISSWFIATEKYNYITQTYNNKVESYWSQNPGLVSIENSRWKFLQKYLDKRGPQVWFSSFVTKVLKVYPYFWFHYLFENIYLKDKEFQHLWDTTPKISADIPHRLQFAGLFNLVNEKIKEEIDSKISPVYKLTWKYDAEEYKEGTILAYLLDSENGLSR